MIKTNILFLAVVFITGCMVGKQVEKVTSGSLSFPDNVHSLYIGEAAKISPLSLPAEISSCTSEPSLPDGLVFNETCELVGVPSVETDLDLFKIRMATKEGVQVTDLWLQIFKEKSVFSGISYASGSYVLNGPGPISPIIPVLQGGMPRSCYAVPSLPANLTLNSIDCRITGFVNQNLAPQTYTIIASNDVQDFTAQISIEHKIPNAPVAGLMAHYDARLSNGLGPQQGCSEQLARWRDLSGNEFPMLVNRDGYNDQVFCIGDSGWIGSGTPADPYRWRSNMPVQDISHSEGVRDVLSFIPKEDGYSSPGYGNWNGTVTVSFWARTLSDDFTFFRSARSAAYSYSNMFFPFSNYSSGTGLDLRAGTEGQYAAYNYEVGTTWRPPKGEWHHYAFANNDTINKLYLDSVFIKNMNGAYFDKIARLGGSSQTYYGFGTSGITEFAQIKMFNRVLSDSEIIQECESYKDFLQDADCRSGLRSASVLNDFKNPIGTCWRNDLTLVDLKNTALPPASTLHFSFQADDGVKVYSDSNCTQEVTSTGIDYTSAMTNYPLYFRGFTTGTKNIFVTPSPDPNTGRLLVPRRKIVAEFSNPPSAIKISFSAVATPNSFTAVNGGAYAMPNAESSFYLTATLVDSQGNPAFTDIDRIVSVREPAPNLITTGNVFVGTISKQKTGVSLAKSTSVYDKVYYLSNMPTALIQATATGLPDTNFSLNLPIADRIRIFLSDNCAGSPYIFFQPAYQVDTQVGCTDRIWSYDIFDATGVNLISTMNVPAKSNTAASFVGTYGTTYIVKDHATGQTLHSIQTQSGPADCGGGD